MHFKIEGLLQVNLELKFESHVVMQKLIVAIQPIDNVGLNAHLKCKNFQYMTNFLIRQFLTHLQCKFKNLDPHLIFLEYLYTASSAGVVVPYFDTL